MIQVYHLNRNSLLSNGTLANSQLERKFESRLHTLVMLTKSIVSLFPARWGPRIHVTRPGGTRRRRTSSADCQTHPKAVAVLQLTASGCSVYTDALPCHISFVGRQSYVPICGLAYTAQH